jgi:uncharacterized protein (TIGR02231 family)
MKSVLIISSIFFTIAISSFNIRQLQAQNRNSIDANSKIDRVMVFQDRALVTRVARLDKIPNGKNEIIFANLPSLIQDDSVRAKIVEGSDIRILDVEVRTVLLEKAPELRIRQLQDKLQSLTDEKTRIQNRQKLLQQDLEYLTGARKHFLETGLSEKPADQSRKTNSRYRIDEYESMMKYLNEKLKNNFDAQFRESVYLRDNDTQISLVRSELSKMNPGQSASPNKKMVKVIIDVPKGGPCKIELSYINYKVSWKPGYDIRVLVDEMKTEFTGYGVVGQSSGEDWTGALISYSTAQPAIGGYLPEIIPLYATIASRLNQEAGDQIDIATQNAANVSILGGRGRGMNGTPDDIDLNTGDQSYTQTEFKGGSLVFNVPRRSDIPSDGSPHRTAISSQTFPVKFEFTSIPRLSPHAYLQAIGSNNMSLPILRGDLNVFMGNDFVGSSNTDTIMPGENFELTLSVNDNIRVSRVLDEKGEQTSGILGGSLKTNFSFIIKVENYTGKDIVMNIFDQIPVSETDEIEVTKVAFSLKPLKQGKNGIVQWQLNMKPKESVTINFSFTVNVPKGKKLAFFRTGKTPAQYLLELKNSRADRSKTRQSSEEFQQELKAPAMKKR